MDDTLQMLKVLSETNGPSGYEHEVRKAVIRYLAPLSHDIVKDRLGSIAGKRVGQADGPTILIAGHMDEVGWMVASVTPEGFLRFTPLGGWWSHVMLAQRVRIETADGQSHIGIIGSKPPHILTREEREKVVPMKELYIDVGARSRDEVVEMGIQPGDPITPVSDFTTLRNDELLLGKALDNRAGCAASIEVLKRLQEVNHPNTVFAGATVQEEVGCRGAETLASLVQPDISIAIDVGPALDTPGLEEEHTICRMGDGPLLLIYDATMIPHVGLRRLVLQTAKELGIQVQLDVIEAGGTDGGSFHMNDIGCPSIALGFATRYIHSHTAMMARKDFDDLVTLVTALVTKLDADTVRRLQEE